MRFISYAQELEDLILYVALRDVVEGFYIDIGANDPVLLSVTKFFYDKGWHGINVEPLRSRCLLLEEERPRDINLCVGIGNARGKSILITADTGSTFLKEVAIKGNFENNRKHSKTMLTLSDIFTQYCKKEKEIHFCKIDVEGYEKYVLEGINNWDEFRPWIYVIESTEPGTYIPSYEDWEDALLSNGYVLAYTTAINRYYIDERKEHLLDRFKNIDKFIEENEIYNIQMKKVSVK